MRATLLITLMVTLISGGLLFRIKHEVLALERSIKHMNHQMNDTKERLTLLKAEWSYLTHPGRINKLVARYLPQAAPLKKSQVLAVPTDDTKRSVVSAPHSTPGTM